MTRAREIGSDPDGGPPQRSYHSQGLQRSLLILRALGSSDSALGLAELSHQLDIPKPTLLRLLVVLEAERFIMRDGERPVYSIGDGLLEIADRTLREADATKIASPILRSLAKETGLTANLGVLHGQVVVHVCVEKAHRPLSFASGYIDHSYCTGLGKMLLSALPDYQLASHVPSEPFTGFARNTITSLSSLKDELAIIRERGYSLDDEERNPGVTCLALPVINGVGAQISISVSGPSAEVDENARKSLIPILTRYAERFGASTRFLSTLRSVPGAYPHSE